MERMKQFNLLNWLMEAVENNHAVQLDTWTGVAIGHIELIDTQGPFPSVFIKHKDAANGVGVVLSHVMTYRMAEGQHQIDLDAVEKKSLH
jgi:hypothetical protein